MKMLWGPGVGKAQPRSPWVGGGWEMGPRRELRPRVWAAGEREAPSSLSENPRVTAGAGPAGTADTRAAWVSEWPGWRQVEAPCLWEADVHE